MVRRREERTIRLRRAGNLTLLWSCLIALVAFSGVGDYIARELHDQARAFRITSHGIEARVNSRDVECTHSANERAGETCTVNVLGDVLSVQAAHPPLDDFTFSECNVTYRSEASRCWASTYSVTSPADATIAQLELTEREMHAIRREHFLANLSEDAWLIAVLVTTGLLAGSMAFTAHIITRSGARIAA